MAKYIFLALAITALFKWPHSEIEPISLYKTQLPDRRKVDVNHDNSLWLQSLKEIGPKRAQSIIENRPYHNWDELLAVKGISSRLLKLWEKDLLALPNN